MNDTRCLLPAVMFYEEGTRAEGVVKNYCEVTCKHLLSEMDLEEMPRGWEVKADKARE